MVGRKVNRKPAAEAWARATLTTLNGLQGAKLTAFIDRAELFRRANLDEHFRIVSSQDPLDRALCFLDRIKYGSAAEMDAMCRNPELRKGFATWLMKFKKLTAPKQQTQRLRRLKSKGPKPEN